MQNMGLLWPKDFSSVHHLICIHLFCLMPTLPRKHGYKRLGTERMYSGIHGHSGSNILRLGGFKLGKIIAAMSEEFVCVKNMSCIVVLHMQVACLGKTWHCKCESQCSKKTEDAEPCITHVWRGIIIHIILRKMKSLVPKSMSSAHVFSMRHMM